MSSAPDDLSLANMATRISLPRAEFESLFDELGRDHGCRRFKIIALLSGAKPYLGALKEARNGGWFEILAERLLAVDAFDQLDERAASTSDIQLELQGMVRPELGMLALSSLNSGTMNAAKRVCRIDIESDPPGSGTGFLVGPEVILTAFHVIEPLLGPGNEPQAGSAERLTVTFDEIDRYARGRVFRVATDWLVAKSARHASEAPNSTYADLMGADPESFRDCLDYAIIRLDHPAGRERGFYRLDPAKYPCVDAIGGQILLFQHPNGDRMHLGQGAGLQLLPADVRTRLRHDANAVDGTSGGLIINKASEPVAMHQCTFRDQAGAAVVNGAIPTACIAANASAHSDAIERILGVDPIWHIRGTGDPVVGRLEFQRRVNSAVTGETRLIAVRGAYDSGKSFTAKILRTMLDEGSHAIVELSATTIALDAFRFVHDLLMTLRVSCDAVPFEGPDTAPDAWIRDALLPSLASALREYARGRTLWLVIDDLDTHPVSSGTTRNLFERIFADLPTMPFLRIVLIGQRGQVPGAAPAVIEYDDITDLTVGEVADYLNRKYVAEGCEKSAAEVLDQARMIVNIAEGGQVARTAAIAHTLLMAGRSPASRAA